MKQACSTENSGSLMPAYRARALALEDVLHSHHIPVHSRESTIPIMLRSAQVTIAQDFELDLARTPKRDGRWEAGRQPHRFLRGDQQAHRFHACGVCASGCLLSSAVTSPAQLACRATAEPAGVRGCPHGSIHQSAQRPILSQSADRYTGIETLSDKGSIAPSGVLHCASFIARAMQIFRRILATTAAAAMVYTQHVDCRSRCHEKRRIIRAHTHSHLPVAMTGVFRLQ